MVRCAAMFLWASSAASSSIDVSFADTSYTHVFSEQWSYDQQTSSGHAKHFDVSNQGGRKALRVRIYKTDKALNSHSDTCPRSELSQTDKANGLMNEVDYVAQWDAMLQHYTKTYQYAFMQVFGGNGPNIFLKHIYTNGSGKYNLLCEKCTNGDSNLPGSAEDDLGKWIAWKVEFRLSKSAGHLNVYRNGKQIHAYTGPTSDGSNHHFKLGMYTQHKPCEPKDATLLLSKLSIVSKSQNALDEVEGGALSASGTACAGDGTCGDYHGGNCCTQKAHYVTAFVCGSHRRCGCMGKNSQCKYDSDCCQGRTCYKPQGDLDLGHCHAGHQISNSTGAVLV